MLSGRYPCTSRSAVVYLDTSCIFCTETKPPTGAVFHFPDASGVTYIEPDPPGLIRYVEPNIPAAWAMGVRQQVFSSAPAMDSRRDTHGLPADSLFGGNCWAARPDSRAMA